MTAVAQTYFMTGRHVRAFIRQPWFVGIVIVQPVVWLFLFGALFSNVTEIPGFGTGGSYLDYLTPGVLVMTALFSCGWSGMGIIEDLDLRRPIYRKTAAFGHFGRTEPEFTWERTDRADALRADAGI